MSEPYRPTTADVRATYADDAGDEYRDVAEGWFDAWLAEERRAAKAEAWDEGLEAGRDRWMDAREFGCPPVNPYRRADQ